MADPAPVNKQLAPLDIRPPAFQRRYIAAETDDPNTLVVLASDESYFVRRQALQNPRTPRWVLDLLVQAGASPDLRGRGELDLNLDPASLRRLAETGPWARQLVAEHPNTDAETLAMLSNLPSVPLRTAIAAHPHADGATLVSLCCDIEDAIRTRAISNPNFPPTILPVLMTAGARSDLQGVRREFGELQTDQMRKLADLGAWGRFLVARHPACPTDLLTEIAQDEDWRVRSGLLDNPRTSRAVIESLIENLTEADYADIHALSGEQIESFTIIHLAHHESPLVRLALARHPAATAESLAILATDEHNEIRRLAADHPHTDPAFIQRLVRAGATPELMGLREPDPTISPEEIDLLLDGGVWARQLAVRHPKTDAETLARLLCDREPKIREWAAVHPNLPPETKRDLIRAGSGTDFQGIMPADPTLPSDVLARIAHYGSWGAWVVANNPYAPIDLLDELADSEDWQVRLFVAKNPGAGAATLVKLREDEVTKVRETANQGISSD